MPQFPYKSYCWAVGTTSFRTVDFNLQVERQLDILDSFWSLDEFANQRWSGNDPLREEYYRFMRSRGFTVGEANRPAKDARQKTSGLVDIGLIDNERRLTDVGRALLAVVRTGDFSPDNLLHLSADSFIYLKQMLKTYNDVDGDIVRPFITVSYILSMLEYLTDDEFRYLAPLCTTPENTASIIAGIQALRGGAGSIDDIIITRLMSMDNYQAALEYLLSSSVSEDVITAVGMNRKSGSAGSKAYDRPYFELYKFLRSIVLDRNEASVLRLFYQIKELSDGPAKLWRQYIFNARHPARIEREGFAALNGIPLLQATTEQELKELFFKQMHLIKAKLTLHDYFDLNRRYFKTTDAVIFADGVVKLDVLPRCWLHSCTQDLLNIAFVADDNLPNNVSLSEIAPFLTIDEQALYANLAQLYDVTVTTSEEAIRIINDERYIRFNALIDERFSRDALIDILAHFEQRNDNEIRQSVTNNATVPTIFEYILGIAWYLISNRNGDILNYMNLSLEADLLPRSHATGGNADIEYVYEETDAYPAHTLLLEATLSDGIAQRRMEMEPVSRHLGEHILNTGDNNAYALFVSTFLHRNVLSDYRNRRTYEYYSENFQNCVNGLKILPLVTTELRTILERSINYEQLYRLFESAYRSSEPIPTWYEREICNGLSNEIQN